MSKYDILNEAAQNIIQCDDYSKFSMIQNSADTLDVYNDTTLIAQYATDNFFNESNVRNTTTSKVKYTYCDYTETSNVAQLLMKESTCCMIGNDEVCLLTNSFQTLINK